MFLTNTRPRRHQEERQGTTFKPKAAAVRISQITAAGWHHQQVYKEWDECREDTHPPSRPNTQLHSSTSLSTTASVQTWLPEDAEGQHLPEPSISYLAPRHCSWTALGTHSTNCHPIFSASARCAPHQLLSPGSVQGCLTPLLPLCTFPHTPHPTSS